MKLNHSDITSNVGILYGSIVYYKTILYTTGDILYWNASGNYVSGEVKQCVLWDVERQVRNSMNNFIDLFNNIG